MRQVVIYEGTESGFQHKPFSFFWVPVFLWALGHDLSECTRLDLTVILISNGNSICSYYMDFMWLILPEGMSLSIFATGEHLFDVAALSRMTEKN